ncbi:MAG: UDP-N-acetylmuramate dehydrogenase [Syntrophobacteraceae bacterium]|nr:UDP-N-acetylmuramate dehydrogenase [Syntrophobacteraceae bacterium]
MNSTLSTLEAIADVEILRGEPLSRHTTFRVGGPVRMVARPRSERALFAFLNAAKELGVPFIVLGEGSNVLAPDGPWDMVVVQLHLALSELVVGSPTPQGGKILYAGAGARLADLIRFCIKEGLEGLEPLAGAPATVGGALFMNASTSLGAISDPLATIDLLGPDGQKRSVGRGELNPGYRTMGISKNSLILGAGFHLRPCETTVLQERVEAILKRRRQSQPLRYPSAGSVFKNPEGRFAGELIEKAGLKGFRIGDAQISQKHANWIVNRGKATAKEILELIEKTENEVYGTFGVRLEREIRILDRLYRNPALC